jgi:predicted type IV restriction endonuclease
MSKGSKTSLEEEISGLAAKIPSLLPHIQTEEATKNAIIWPLLRILGYDPFDPREIVPEYPAPPGSKLGKKVDIAIIDGASPSVIWECKWSGKELDAKDADQLREYFPFIDSVHLAVLTNGKKFLFFADGNKPNIMDQAPFFEVDFLDLKSQDLEFTH